MWLTLEGQSTGMFGIKGCMVTVLLDRVPDPYIEKRAAAIALLGDRWICASARYVQRGDYSQFESHGANVMETWARAREKLAGEQKIILPINGSSR